MFQTVDGTRYTFLGSSNLTYSGMQGNLELSVVSDEFAPDKLNQFFRFCEEYGKVVTPEVIDTYARIEAQCAEKQGESMSFGDLVRRALLHANEAPLIKMNLAHQYFTYEDYECLFSHNASLNHSHLKERRKAVQQKLLAIHQRIQGVAHELDLHEHWRPENITSKIEPGNYNGHRVSWIGIRYGKSKKQIQRLDPGDTKGDGYSSFIKHASIQVALYPYGFAVAFFHAIRHGAWDRQYVRDQILYDPAYMQNIIGVLSNLKSHGYVWTIDDPPNGKTLAEFSLDKEDLANFPSFYKQDADGWESSLQKTWSPDDPTLTSLDNIVNAITVQMRLLAPLYRLMAQIPTV